MVALSKSLLWAVVAACSASALPTLKIDIELPGISLAIAAKLNVTGSGFGTIVEADRARAARLKQVARLPLNLRRQSTGIEVENTAVRASVPPPSMADCGQVGNRR